MLTDNEIKSVVREYIPYEPISEEEKERIVRGQLEAVVSWYSEHKNISLGYEKAILSGKVFFYYNDKNRIPNGIKVGVLCSAASEMFKENVQGNAKTAVRK